MAGRYEKKKEKKQKPKKAQEVQAAQEGQAAQESQALQKKQKKRMSTGKKVVLTVAITLLVLILAVVIAAVIWYNGTLNLITRPDNTTRQLTQEELDDILGWVPESDRIGQTEEPTEEITEAPTEIETEPTEADYSKVGKIINIMLIGTDYRVGEEHKLSDSMILCTVNRETKTLTMTSFMRDMYVKLPNYQGHKVGKQRINVAYDLGYRWGGELGGMEMLAQCVNENFSAKVDHSVEVDFEDFMEVIDLLGGVEVELTSVEAKYMNKQDKWRNNYKEGMNQMDGYQALVYARMRHSSAGDGDFNRTQRQRNIITCAVNKARNMNLIELNKLVKEVLPMVLTDMTNSEITTYLATLLPILPDLEIVSNRIPADKAYYPAGVEISGVKASVLVPDLKKNSEIMIGICGE